MRELETVVLARDVEEHKLQRGDMGVVVHVYPKADAFEVEFVTADGNTVAVLTLTRADIRTVRPGEIPHARQLALA